MHYGLPISDEVWRFFLKDADGTHIGDEGALDVVPAWEWEWLRQVASLLSYRLDLTDPYAPVIQLKLQCEEYWIALRPGSHFPFQPPQVNCAYQNSFSFEWSNDKTSNPQACATLADLVARYCDYCSELDLAILQIRSLDNDKMMLLGYSFSEEDDECLVVRIRLKRTNGESVVIHVDWRNPTDFPRFISSTETQIFRNLDCDVWDPEESLSSNLLKFVDEEHCEDVLHMGVVKKDLLPAPHVDEQQELDTSDPDFHLDVF